MNATPDGRCITRVGPRPDGGRSVDAGQSLHASWADILEGNFAAAVDPYRQMFDMDPGNPLARLFYVWVLALNRRVDEMASILETFPPELRGSLPARIAFFVGHAATGNAEGAASMLSPDIDAARTATDVFPRLLAQGCALAGMVEPALDWWEVAVERGFINYPFLAYHDPFIHGLRSHPRFLRLIDNVRHRWERFDE